MNALFASLDWIQRQASRAGLHFQWPCWLLAYAWDRQATPYLPVSEEKDR